MRERLLHAFSLLASWRRPAAGIYLSHPVDDETAFRRFQAACFDGREVSVFLTAALERRLRASMHRMNAETVAAGCGPDDLFDLDRDLTAAMMAAMERGIEEMEREDGVEYDRWTGWPAVPSLDREK